MSILDEIIEAKKAEIAEKKSTVSLDEIKASAGQSQAARGFKNALLSTQHPSIISEVKRASPSKGDIRPDLDPVETATAYQDAGAACISILTDKKYFNGSLEFLANVSSATDIPILRKDFIIDPYQVYESKVNGADAILLIVAALEKDKLRELIDLAANINLDVLLEIHSHTEREVALEVSNSHVVLGINNRDLKTFETNLEVTKELCQDLNDDTFVVSESGIENADDIKILSSYGANAFLIGESLVREGNPGDNLSMLIKEVRDE